MLLGKIFPLWILLATCGLLVAAEHLMYPLVSSLAGLIALSSLTGIGGGLFFGCNASYIFQIVDHHAASTAISVQGVCLALMGIIGSVTAGNMIDRFGITVLTTVVGFILLIAAILFLSFCLFGRYIRKNPICIRNERIEII